MDARGAPDWLARCDLPRAWAGQTAWTVLDADYGDGRAFVQCWETWRQDPQRPHMLHYVGIAAQAPHIIPLTTKAEDGASENTALWQTLAAQCAGRGAGFHRILLDDGRVSLTLCVGEMHAMLKEQGFLADTMRAANTSDPWVVQWLARCCKHGARLYVDAAPTAIDVPQTALRHLLRDAGFVCDVPAPSQAPATSAAQCPSITGQFHPRWEISTRRSPLHHPIHSPARCAIVGAGISGASVAHALALRGWQVAVFDQERLPAGAASGVPVGLAVAHISADDNPLSRLSRSGTRLAMQHAQQLLACGHDWEPSGVLERKPGVAAQWHPHAAWMKAAALVQAWLNHSAITFTGLTCVSTLHRAEGLWHLTAAQGHALGAFEHVVIANAMGCKVLLRQALQSDCSTDWAPGLHDQLNALQPVHGTLSHGTYAEEIDNLPTTPVNGNGCFFPQVPGPHGAQWATGSTFETGAMAAADLGTQHSSNLQRLRAVLPEWGDTLVQALDRGPVSLWSSTRCVSHDRLPLVGPADTAARSGLWVNVGMGARGLSLAPLCAELLMARMCGEPLPVESSLARRLDACRVRRVRPSAAGSPPGAD